MNRTKLAALEQAADAPPGFRVDESAARIGESLQPRGEVRGLTDHRLLPGGPGPQQVAHDGEAAGDPDARGQPFTRGRDLANRFQRGQGGAHGALGIGLVRLGPAEIDQDSVAQVLGDKATEATDRLGNAAVIGPDHLAHVLGVQACGKGGRADEVGEHHGQLAPLSLGGRQGRPGDRDPCLGGRGHGGRRAGAQGGNGGEQLAAVTDRDDAEPAQVVGGEVGQDIAIDVILAERLFVLSQPQIAQPRANVHGTSRIRGDRNARVSSLPQNGGEGVMNRHERAPANAVDSAGQRERRISARRRRGGVGRLRPTLCPGLAAGAPCLRWARSFPPPGGFPPRPQGTEEPCHGDAVSSVGPVPLRRQAGTILHERPCAPLPATGAVMRSLPDLRRRDVPIAPGLLVSCSTGRASTKSWETGIGSCLGGQTRDAVRTRFSNGPG